MANAFCRKELDHRAQSETHATTPCSCVYFRLSSRQECSDRVNVPTNLKSDNWHAWQQKSKFLNTTSRFWTQLPRSLVASLVELREMPSSCEFLPCVGCRSLTTNQLFCHKLSSLRPHNTKFHLLTWAQRNTSEFFWRIFQTLSSATQHLFGLVRYPALFLLPFTNWYSQQFPAFHNPERHS